jgi:hypothetical protein
MTRPNVVAFAYDSPKEPKIFLRTLLYSTAQRGHVIENMFVTVQRGDDHQMFPMWGYQSANQLVLGSGLYVPRDGIAAYHHFVPAKKSVDYGFLTGAYTVDVYAELVNRKSPIHLCKLEVFVSLELAKSLVNKNAGIVFAWEPYSREYVGTVNTSPRLQQFQYN